jgi:hypothetical protein
MEAPFRPSDPANTNPNGGANVQENTNAASR